MPQSEDEALLRGRLRSGLALGIIGGENGISQLDTLRFQVIEETAGPDNFSGGEDG